MNKKLYARTAKLKVLFLMLIYIQIHPVSARQDSLQVVHGQVFEAETEIPLAGALILLNEIGSSQVTDKDGRFSFYLTQGTYRMTISFIGFQTSDRTIEVPQPDLLRILMEADEMALGEVEVLSTGYQEIPKERATGSFVHIDRELIDRRVSTNILERIEDVSSGLIFNRNSSSTEPISIRGRSTLFGNTQPLIVVDNLPYEGSIDNINPNDVESITVLKDAAAASIWGAQAGNGVIVINTKSGSYNQPLKVAFQSNLTIVEKPDLFYAPQMEIAGFIAQEKRLFESGYYNSRINSLARTPLSPVVETLLAAREGKMSQQEADILLAQYGIRDSRRDLTEIYYRPAVQQQYAFQVNGGGEAYLFNFSGGYDHNLSGQIGTHDDRVTLNAKQNWKLAKGKMEISTGFYLSRAAHFSDTGIPSPGPYESLVDGQGNALSIVAGLNTRFVESTQDAGLLDWRSFPVNEIGKRNDRTVSMDTRINLGVKYSLLKGLDAQVRYQYWTNNTEIRNIETEELFLVRHQINSYTQVTEDGDLSYAVPRGSRFTNTNASGYSHNVRTSLSYSLDQGPHQLTSLAGWELRDHSSISDRMGYYGYDDATGLSTPVDFITRFPQYQNPGSSPVIPYQGVHTGVIDRYLSYFGNAGYTFRGKYLLTASARKDMSNLFGVESNQKGVPLWSLGAGWIVSEENFYGLDWMPFLKLRMSYGYNGNVDKNTTAYTTIRYDNFHSLIPGLRYAYISNPPNPDLRWEKIRILNFAFDFETKSGRIGGILEYYTKNGQDLIGETEVPGSNGLYQFRGNFSNTTTRGFDLTFNTVNVDRALRWSSQFLLSGWKDKVTEFAGSRSITQILGANSSNLVPVEGNPLHSVYSLPWAGLDPLNGNPLGYLDGEVSDEYSRIIGASTLENINYHGSARPTVFGSVRNTFGWKGWSFSFNVTYRLGYFFRRSSVDYTSLSRGEITHSDYSERWVEPGDEMFTQIPSRPENLDTQRHNFFRLSESLIERGDHIRLQDIRLGYKWSRADKPKLPLRNIEAFTYLNNLGVLWKLTDIPLDPDFRSAKPLTSISFGLRANF
ncbi:SusC/RagA family TonB-linked outer membrane protein [Algoriphagus sp. Y33]|uniref:SusC/RagA family TonB-linked outer membrane protein n=1 Tax=Algoriphagus sp. Y33 TaxID=2772483 RepID=UPI0017804E42|nr:SusC/RagA family TonB-linked outer membrane protein [Algoriphagus sp. Y33]